MREWTLEERYKVLESPKQIEQLYERICKSPYRQSFHIQPVTGLSSDPNGFTNYNDTWHLFYQWCPWGAVHGLKYWYHVCSKDLIHWENKGIGLKPDTVYDNKGVHSGSAITINDELFLYYTGNHRDENWIRTPWTCTAKLVGDKFEKLPEPLFGPHKDYSEHQRDPKIIYNEETESYFILLGAQSNDLRGSILVYESKDPINGWKFKGELKVEGYENFAGMWECPSLQKIGDKDLLIFSPQYIKLENRGNSTNHNIYFIGQMDYNNLTFTPDHDYEFLDYGFDFYAAQLASNVKDEGKAVMIAWIGLPDNHYPTEEEDWEGSMTIPRELYIKDGNLIQKPVSGIESLRSQKLEQTDLITEPCELYIEVEDGDFILNLFADRETSEGFSITYNSSSGKVVISKAGLKKRFNEEIGEILEVPMKSKLKNLRIFIDKSSIEIFFNEGERTFTSHIYPTAEENKLKIKGNCQIKIWQLERSVTDDFII